MSQGHRCRGIRRFYGNVLGTLPWKLEKCPVGNGVVMEEILRQAPWDLAVELFFLLKFLENGLWDIAVD